MLLLVTTWFKVRPYNESDTEVSYYFCYYSSFSIPKS